MICLDVSPCLPGGRIMVSLFGDGYPTSTTFTLDLCLADSRNDGACWHRGFLCRTSIGTYACCGGEFWFGARNSDSQRDYIGNNFARFGRSESE